MYYNYESMIKFRSDNCETLLSDPEAAHPVFNIHVQHLQFHSRDQSNPNDMIIVINGN